MSVNEEILLHCLEELSSLSLQEERWVKGVPGELATFEETVCALFDDSNFGLALKKGMVEERYGDYFAKKVDKLSSLISKIPNYLPPEDLIHYPLMGELRLISSFLLDELKRDENFFSDEWLSPEAFMWNRPLQ